MAKTAIVNKATGKVVGISAGTEGTNKMVIEGAGLTNDDVELVTAKNFKPTDEYKTFKEMSMTQEERDAAAKKAEEAEAEKQRKQAEKDARAKEKAEKAANKAPSTRGDAVKLEGEYHILKEFPATRADHPKMPIWEAIANNRTVEAAKEACPKENPKRLTNGVYTFNSEFRYFLKAGYVGMGAKPEAPAEGAEQTTGEGQEAAA